MDYSSWALHGPRGRSSSFPYDVVVLQEVVHLSWCPLPVSALLSREKINKTKYTKYDETKVLKIDTTSTILKKYKF